MGRFHSENPGELIRSARLDAELTQTELARRANLRQPSLAQMESGVRNVSDEMLERVLVAADYRPSLALAQHFDRILTAAANRGLRNVRVFGSVARGEDGIDSDIDLLVTPDEGVNLFDLALFIDDVQRLTGFHVDAVIDDGSLPLGREVGQETIPL